MTECSKSLTRLLVLVLVVVTLGASSALGASASPPTAPKQIALASNDPSATLGGTSGTAHIGNSRLPMGSISARPAAPLAYVEKAPEPVATARHSAASSGDLLYVMGGEIANTFNITSTVQRYDPASDTWQFMASMPGVLADSGACSMNGKIYLPGGWNGNLTTIFYIYDVGTNSWATGASVPTAYVKWPTVVCDPGAGSAGKIHRIGGDNGNNTINAHYLYDVATNTWTAAADLPASTAGSQGGLINGHIYVTGGNQFPGPESTTYDYNIATDTWTTRALMNIGCMFAAYGVDPNGRLWVAGGAFCTNGPSATTRTEYYDPVANTWTLADNLNEAVYHTNGDFAGTLGGNALFHVVGGETFSNPIPNNQQLAVPMLGTPTPTQTQTPGVPTATATNTPITPTTTATATSTATSTVALPSATAAPSGTATSTAGPSATVTARQASPTRRASSTPGLSTATATVTAIPTHTSTPCTITFSDVPQGSTFYPYIHCLACLGIVSGYADGTFRLGNNVTRGQAAKILSNSAGYQDPIPPGRQTFEDVAPGSTFWLFIERVYLHGMINGYQCGLAPASPCVPPLNRPYFLPANNMTRGQLAKIDSNAKGYNDQIPPNQQTFQDVAPGSAFWLFIERVYLHGVINGYQCGSPPAGQCVPPLNRPYFLPYNNVTRGQASKIVSITFFPDCHTP